MVVIPLVSAAFVCGVRSLCLGLRATSVAGEEIKCFAAQGMLLVEGAMTDRGCEDFATGIYLPCDDAGIPGLGGSSSPCALYTAGEAAARLWPLPVVEQLEAFRAQAPEESARARARAAIQRGT